MKLLNKTYRLSTCYELMRYEMLPDSLKYQLNDLENDIDFYGVLIPNNNKNLPIKSVNKELALLLLSLKEPGVLPNYILKNKEERFEDNIMDLLLSNVLEVIINGKFVGGSSLPSFFNRTKLEFFPENNISKLTIEGIKHIIKLPINEVSALGARLYFYNRYPLSNNWKNYYKKNINISSLEENSQLQNYWNKMSAGSNHKGWIFWQKRNNKIQIDDSDSIYKLYISPKPKDIIEVINEIIPAITIGKAYRFKYGADLYGVLRPDKIIVYYKTYDDLFNDKNNLIKVLGKYDSHGVPLTFQLDKKGILSWGIDPPQTAKKIKWQETESWRVWIANRIALSVIQARSESLEDSSILDFVVNKVSKLGINVDFWKPVLEKEFKYEK